MSDGSGAARPGRMVALDGMRGIAAIVVVIGHSYAAVRSPSGVAGLAVQIFFVLSGYCLATSALRGDRLLSRAQYMLRRIFRIHPPFVFALILAWLVSLAPLDPKQMVNTSFWIRGYMRAHLEFRELLGFLFFPGSADGQMPVGWTLEVEMVFSLVLPIFVWVARRGHWLLLILASLALVGQQEKIYEFQLYALHFSLGIAVWSERNRIARFSEERPRIMATAVLAGFAYFLWIGTVREKDAIEITLRLQALLKPQGCMALAGAFLIAGAVHVSGIRGFFSWSPVAFLGRISYSLYLLHFTILLLCARQISGELTDSDVVFFILGVCGISIALATVTYRWVELASIRWGDLACRALARRAQVDEELSRIGTADR